MSYNIDSEECLELDAWMYAKDIDYLRATLGDEFAEDCFLGEPPYGDLVTEGLDKDTKVPLKNLSWSGEFSGRSFDEIFLAQVVPCIHGHAEVVFCYEGGDSFAGYIIDDGEAWEADVFTSLKRGKKVVGKTRKEKSR
jgi:hypothetical protein